MKFESNSSEFEDIKLRMNGTVLRLRLEADSSPEFLAVMYSLTLLQPYFKAKVYPGFPVLDLQRISDFNSFDNVTSSNL